MYMQDKYTYKYNSSFLDCLNIFIYLNIRYIKNINNNNWASFNKVFKKYYIKPNLYNI